MNIRESLAWGIKRLNECDSPRLESEVLLMEVLGQDRVFLKAHPEYDLTRAESLLYKKFVQERTNNVPVAYIVGYKHWCDLDIEVNEAVLIPRDETEVLVDYVIKDQISNSKYQISILDLGTGSGAIAVALAKQCELLGIKYQVLGGDISHQALELAQRNARKYLSSSGSTAGSSDHSNLDGPRPESGNDNSIDFIQSDLLAQVKDQYWDIIVANLPYVPENLPVSLEVEKEPSLALFSGEDGLDHYRRLERQLAGIRFGVLWIEFLPTQKRAIGQIFTNYKIEYAQDVGGRVYFARITSGGLGLRTLG